MIARTPRMARKPPPTAISDETVRERPPRINRRTSGSSVAARINARTTGITTSGMATKMPMNRPASPTATRIRQLHAATRSSHDGTRAGSCGIGPGSRMSMVADATANTMAATGTAANSPMTPAELVAGREHDEDHRRVDVDALAVHGRPDAVAQDRVADPDQHEQRDHGTDPQRGIRHDDDDPGGDEAAEVGDVAAEEGEHRKRQRQRHAEDDHEDVVGDADGR